MFTIDKRSFNLMRRKLVNDVGEDLQDDLRRKVVTIKPYYKELATDEKIKYYSDDKVVGSEDYGVAVLNAGRVAGEYPPFNKIRDWVMNVKDGGIYASASESVIDDITWKVSAKIRNEGIDPTWFVERVLEFYER